MVPLGGLLIGLLTVVGGAELVVRGGSRIAARFGISPMVIGVTVVALGTSAPELAIGIDAALRGSGSLAVGNIAGTNTLNILFILGLMALVRPLRLQSQTLRLDLPMLVGAASLLLLLTADALLSRLDGGILVLLGVVYTALIVHIVRRETATARTEFRRGQDGGEDPATTGQLLRDALGLLVGIAVIVVGADWLVSGAVGLARGFGVSETLIGLTIVAIGTSAPELVTAIVAILRKEREIAVGNLLGSSIYNILFILGSTALVTADGIPIEPALMTIDIPVMLAATIACVPVFLTGRRIRRLEGAAFVAAYLAYLGYLLVTRT